MSDATRETVRITIDGNEVEVAAGELLIKAAQEHGTYIPRFCWHERMKPVGMCRMCLVEVEGVRGLPPACTTTVTDGMVVTTKSDAVKKVQDGVLEFLLINHPLDCPVCDRGGECPLQDQTLSFGPGESRFVEEKRHWEKPIAISDLVLLDRERCIQCARCTRFADEIAGDPLIDFGERGAQTEVITYPDEPFVSYFSGNTVQICPVGALTAKPYRFKARPWDLSSVETSCTTCAVHCRGALQSSSNRLVRLLGVDSEPVNQGWLCDKGRFSYEATDAPERERNPMVRKGGELVECSWPEALDAAADGIRRALEAGGPASVALIGGARGTNEDAYAWARLMKGVVGTDNVDAQLGDGLPASLVLGLSDAVIPDLDRAAAIVTLAPDLKEELPVLFLRVKRAALDLGVPLVELAPRATGLTRYAGASIRFTPGQQRDVARKVVQVFGGGRTGDAAVDAIAPLVDGRDGPVVVIVGRQNVAESSDATVQAVAELRSLPAARFLVALRRGNVRGAIESGLTPGFLPGRVALDAGREWFGQAWGSVPSAPGLDTPRVLAAAQQGRIGALVLLGADVADDCPDGTLARAGIEGAGFVVAVDSLLTDTTKHADVFLPVTVWGEKAGSATNLEGRVQRLGQKVTAEGTPMDDWRIAAELAARLGADFDLESIAEVQEELARIAPGFEGVDARLIARARDGVVLPLAEHRDEVVLTRLTIPLTDASWEPIRPGVASADTATSQTGTGRIEQSGTGALETIKPGEGGGEEPGGDISSAAGSLPEGRTGAPTPTVARPPMFRWDGVAPDGAAPPRDAYALRLVTGRTLYDAGVAVQAAPSLAGLAAPAVVRLEPGDRDRIGVRDGDEVRLVTSRGSVTLPVLGDDATPAGVAFVPFDTPGAGVRDLVDATSAVTDVRVETIR